MRILASEQGRRHLTPDWLRLQDAAVALTTAAAIAGWSLIMMTGETAGTGGREPAPGQTTAIDGPETLIGGYIGAPYTYPSDVKFTKGRATDLTAHDVKWEAKPFKSPIYYGLRALRWGGGSGMTTGAMVDFLHSKAIAVPSEQIRFSGTRDGRPAAGTAKIGDTFKHLEFSHGHNLLTLNGLLRLGPMTGWLRPYVGAGAGIALPHTEIGFLDETVRTYEYQYAGPAGQAMAGLEIRLPRVTLFLEYRLSVAAYDVPLSGRDSRSFLPVDLYSQLMEWLSGREPKAGRARTMLTSHQVVGGMASRIQSAAAGAR